MDWNRILLKLCSWYTVEKSSTRAFVWAYFHWDQIKTQSSHANPGTYGYLGTRVVLHMRLLQNRSDPWPIIILSVKNTQHNTIDNARLSIWARISLSISNLLVIICNYHFTLLNKLLRKLLLICLSMVLAKNVSKVLGTICRTIQLAFESHSLIRMTSTKHMLTSY